MAREELKRERPLTARRAARAAFRDDHQRASVKIVLPCLQYYLTPVSYCTDLRFGPIYKTWRFTIRNAVRLHPLQNDISANTIAALEENGSGTIRAANLCGLPGVRQGTPVRLANNAAHKTPRLGRPMLSFRRIGSHFRLRSAS